MTLSDLAFPPGALSVSQLQRLFPNHDQPAPSAPPKSPSEHRMEVDDAPILRYIFQAHQPVRHLEFGTWRGAGACLCLESSPATVWTLNLPEGESRPDGRWCYGERVLDESRTPPGAVTVNFGQDEHGPRTYHRTDAGGYIGHLYRERDLGHRVCQIYCDSRKWDHSAYPEGFFDSVLIDGGHQPEVVVSDTRKALRVVRTGGLILWHDFSPLPEVRAHAESVRGVFSGIESIFSELMPQLSTLRWIEPSWILLGIKK